MARTIAVIPNPGPLDKLASVYGQRITAALPLLWARRMSMHDSRGNVHWQSTEVWSPAEREAVRLALERFVGLSAPARADHDLPEQRTAVLLRAADGANNFRGFVMLVVDNRRLRGKGHSVQDLPVPVQRAVHDWAVRLGSASAPELSAVQAETLLAQTPAPPPPVEPLEEPQVDEFLTRLREFPVALVAQQLAPLQRGMRIRRYEVLLRDGAATLGDLAPVALLREADGKGLGAVIDRRVFGALAVWLAEHVAAFTDEPAQFSVNLAASTLADPNLLRFIELCIAKARVPASLVAFEIDQSLWRSDRGRVEQLAQSLETLGAGLIIDNCTLHEDTAALLSLPGVRLAKIDRALTRELGASRTAQMRVAGLAQIARVGGLHTVAKQVELAAEQELLRALGVDFQQGYAAAAPLPLDEIAQQHDARMIVDDSASDGATDGDGDGDSKPDGERADGPDCGAQADEALREAG